MSLFNLAARAGIPAARSAMRFLSKLKKPPKGITVYRGEPWDASPKLMKEVRNWMYGPTAKYGQSRASPLKVGRKIYATLLETFLRPRLRPLSLSLLIPLRYQSYLYE